MMGAGRGRKGHLVRITLGTTGTWELVEDGKGGKPEKGRQALLARGTPLVRPAWEVSADE